MLEFSPADGKLWILGISADGIEVFWRWLPGKDIAALQRGEPADWAWEAHRLAVEVAYVLPENHELGIEYYHRSLSIVDRQLALAGIRLARLLNEAFAQ